MYVPLQPQKTTPVFDWVTNIMKDLSKSECVVADGIIAMLSSYVLFGVYSR